MNKIYYNPNFERPKARITGIEELEQPWAALYAKNPEYVYASYEDALASNVAGVVHFWKDGVIYEGHCTADWCFKPCEGVECNGGINWDSYYACDPLELMEYLKQHYKTIFGAEPRYSEEFGVWSIQVHYDGRCR